MTGAGVTPLLQDKMRLGGITLIHHGRKWLEARAVFEVALVERIGDGVGAEWDIDARNRYGAGCYGFGHACLRGRVGKVYLRAQHTVRSMIASVVKGKWRERGTTFVVPRSLQNFQPVNTLRDR